MLQKKRKSIVPKNIIKILGEEAEEVMDILAVEEPLEISISILGATPPVIDKNISITMRTPGNDPDLGIGFLFTEGILVSGDQIISVTSDKNTLHIQLNDSESIDLGKLERHFYTSSSCGVCGKSSIDAIKTVCRLSPSATIFQIDKNLIKSFPEILKQRQTVFNTTGGIHAAALFDRKGQLVHVQEDVGRHNALDKLIGLALQQNPLPLDQHLLFLSGRASFELIQKAAMAGIQFIMAVGAPSSLAVDMAIDHDITLIGFLSKTRYNIYTGVKRIKI